MMEAALEGLTRPDGTRPMLIAVTQLTSTDQDSMERDLLINEPIDKVVMHYAHNAKSAGLDGVVCSPLEAQRSGSFLPKRIAAPVRRKMWTISFCFWCCCFWQWG